MAHYKDDYSQPPGEPSVRASDSPVKEGASQEEGEEGEEEQEEAASQT